MAPSLENPRLVEKNLDGLWGKPTSTIDWCEANYEVTPYIAEFWNTISNVLMIVLPLVGAAYSYYDGFELRYTYTNLGLAMVGIGSWCFHGTLLYEMQLLDELPMIWGSAFLLYVLMRVDEAPRGQNKTLMAALFIYCTVVTVVYLSINQPVFHEVAYGIMVFGMVVYSIRIVRHFEHNWWIFIIGLVSYGTGFVLWNIDNVFCKQLRQMREDLGYPIKPLLQGHAWWHVLTGTGTYLAMVFASHSRAKYLRRDPEFKYLFRVWPVVRLPSTAAKRSSAAFNNNMYKNGDVTTYQSENGKTHF